MDRKLTAVVVAGGAAVGLAAGYAAPVLAASESRDAPSPGPYNTYTHGTTDGWHVYPNGGVFNSTQSYTYTTQPANQIVNWDEAWWKFDRQGTYTSVQVFDTSSGIMLDYASYATFNKTNDCVSQGAYSNVMVTVLTNGYINGALQLAEPGCLSFGWPVGADIATVNW